MSSFTFNISRDQNNKIIKAPIQLSTSTNILSREGNLTSFDKIINVSELLINNTAITVPITTINNLLIGLTPGVIKENKPVVIDINKNIEGFGNIICDILEVNGENITSDPEPAADDLSNVLLTDLTPGTCLANKALVLDNDKNIVSITSLGANEIIIDSKKLRSSINTSTSTNISDLNSKSLNQTAIETLFNNSDNFLSLDATHISEPAILTDITIYNINWFDDINLFIICLMNRMLVSDDGLYWNSIAYSNTLLKDVVWSPSLNMLVAVGVTGGSVGICYSGSSYSTLQLRTISNSSWNSVDWSPSLGLFVATGGTGIAYSSNGTSWSSVALGVGSWHDVKWIPELAKFFICNSTPGAVNTNIMYSSNGINWYYSVCPICSIAGNVYYSKYYNMLFVGTHRGSIMSSIDGITYSYRSMIKDNSDQFNNNKKIKYIDELNCFISIGYNISSANKHLSYSFNGLNWKSVNIISNSSSTFTGFAWSPSLGILIIVNESAASVNRILVSKPLISLNKNIIMKNIQTKQCYYDANTSYLGIGTTSPNSNLEIYNTTGKLLKLTTPNLSSSTNYMTFDVSSTGICTVNIVGGSRTFDIPHLGYDLLMLNGTYLLSTATDLNLLSGITPGNVLANKIITCDSSRNISGINTFKSTSLVVNGIQQTTSDEVINTLIRDIEMGTTIANKIVVPDANNILNINSLSTKLLDINASSFYSNQITSSNGLSKNIINNMTRNNEYNINDLLSNPIQTTGVHPTITSYKIHWSPYLKLFVAQMAYSRVGYSSDGIVWNYGPFYDIAGAIDTVVIMCMCWSNDLKKFIGHTINRRIVYSTNGMTWGVIASKRTSILQPSYYFTCIKWISELRIFVAAGYCTSGNNIGLSKNGIIWTVVSTGVPNAFRDIEWAPSIGMLVAVADTSVAGQNRIFYSTNGYNWLPAITQTPVTTGFSSVAWSNKLRMFIALTKTTTIVYSYNGINWYNIQTPAALSFIMWIDILGVFVATGYNSLYLMYSYNGFTWIRSTNISLNSENWFITWSEELNTLIITRPGNATNVLLYRPAICGPSTLMCNPGTITTDITNGYMGLGTSPTNMITSCNDQVYKTTNNTWTITSDMRLKENIEPADLDRCLELLELIRLVKYKWKNRDGYQLGWIADEVEEFLPKAITIINANGLSDCKTINTDQLIAVLYGAVKKLINQYESNKLRIDNIRNYYNK